VQQTNITYQWTIQNVEGILSTAPEVIIERVDTSTTFELTISSTVCSLSDSLEINVQVIPSPKVAIAVVDSGAICQGNSLFLEAVTDSLSYEYSWTGPANFIATNKNPIIRNSTTANNGIYELVIQDAQGCKSEAASLVIEAIEAQLTPPTIVGPTMSCASEMIILSLLEFYDTTYNFEWINRDREVIERQATLEITGTDALAIAPYRVRISQNDCYSDYSVREAPSQFPLSCMKMPSTNGAE